MSEEALSMKTIWKRKWLVVVATLAMVLSLGAVAWAATDGGVATDEEVASDAVAQEGTAEVGAAVSEGDSETTATGVGAGLRQGLKERREKMMQRLEDLREKMTPEDQGVYDELSQTIKELRATIKEARQDLAATLKELRQLVGKYRDNES
jgi:flagellar biosynthesis/type III secretory pathway protein FliH